MERKSNKPPKKKLTIREKKFVNEMANPKTKSVRQAALKAGYAPSTASVDIYKNLEKPRISEAIQKRIERAVRHHKITPEEVLGSAAFNMRSSMDDLINNDGYFDLEKARETGAIDLVKEMEVIQTIDPKSNEKTIRHKVKFESPASARKEVANYIGLEKSPVTPAAELTDLELAQELFRRLIKNRGWTVKKALAGIKQRFPEIDVNQLNA